MRQGGVWAEFAGDCEVDPTRFDNLAETVDKIKNTGLKAMLWMAPMHCGPKSNAYSDYKHLLAKQSNGSYCKWFCPRTKKATERAVEVIKMVIEKYHLDGLKIDFLDMIKPVHCSSEEHLHDFDTIGEGMDYFFNKMNTAMKELIDDPIIEFRQDYANIHSRRFATAFRGNDAPFDFDHIRRETALLEPYSGNIPVHADYAFWHPDDKLENKAKMMATIMLGCVPTLSHELTKFTKEENLLVKNWINFYEQWKNALTTGTFTPLSFDQHYSIIRLMGDNEVVFGIFTPYFPGNLSLPEKHVERIAILNGTNRSEIFCKLKNLKGEYSLTGLDCFLQKKSQQIINETSPVIDLFIPEGGMMILTKN
jgi:alpha-galactosidase